MTGKAQVKMPAKVRLVDPRELQPHPRNPREHDELEIQDLMASMKTYGWTQPIICQRKPGKRAKLTGRIVAGAGRWLAALKLQEAGELDLVPVLDQTMTDDEALAYMVADNRLTDRSTWDWGKLGAILVEDLKLGPEARPEDLPTGFSAEDIKAFVDFAGPPRDDSGDDARAGDAGGVLTGPDDRAGRFILVYSTPEDKALWCDLLRLEPDTSAVVLTADDTRQRLEAGDHD